jgi:hypothetical protein
MYYFNKKTEEILSHYEDWLEMIDSVPVGFTGVASERPPAVYTSEISADTLWFAAGVSFSEGDVLVRISSRSPQYDWMANNDPTPQDTPIGAVAGISSEVLPVLPLIQPFFLKANGTLKHQFTNSATSPVTGGIITWRLLKLINPINGGWDYKTK